MTY
ncbi:hypothetical protein ECEC1868_0450, partial [Escherichia coli EC1868]|jgi:hypothetical protein